MTYSNHICPQMPRKHDSMEDEELIARSTISTGVAAFAGLFRLMYTGRPKKKLEQLDVKLWRLRAKVDSLLNDMAEHDLRLTREVYKCATPVTLENLVNT